MKDKNGIEICCKNCELYNGKFCEARETYPYCNKGGYFNPTTDAYEARIAELQKENALLKDGDSHIMDVKISPKFIKSIIRIVNSEVEAVKRKLRFTNEEIDFLKKAISMAILDCETNPPKPSDENLKLMWSIKAKCDELLKERKD